MGVADAANEAKMHIVMNAGQWTSLKSLTRRDLLPRARWCRGPAPRPLECLRECRVLAKS